MNTARLTEASIHPQLRKTSMCKFHLIGVCSKGEQCPYAHDPSEIQERPDFSRTKLCKRLITAGYCHLPPGECKFAHRIQDLQNDVFAKPCVGWVAGNCAHGAKCRFAHSYTQLIGDAIVTKSQKTKQSQRSGSKQKSNQVKGPLSKESLAAFKDQSKEHQGLALQNLTRHGPMSIAPPPGLSPMQDCQEPPRSGVGPTPGFPCRMKPTKQAETQKQKQLDRLNRHAATEELGPKSEFMCVRFMSTGHCEEAGCPFSHRLPTPEDMVSMLMELKPNGIKETAPEDTDCLSPKLMNHQDMDPMKVSLRWCKYGGACRIQDPTHRLQFNHPATSGPPKADLLQAHKGNSRAASITTSTASTASQPQKVLLHATGAHDGQTTPSGAASTASSEEFQSFGASKVGIAQDPVMLNEVVIRDLKNLLDDLL